MKSFWLVVLGSAVALAAYVYAESVWPASAVRIADKPFPEVTGSNLEGKRYNLPADFEGEKNLCLIAFTREQQDDVDTWLTAVKPLLGTPGFEMYELPTISKGNPAFRGWLDSAMRDGIPDRKQRERTITLYLDKKAFRDSLGLRDEKRIYALLVNRDGAILWQSEGVCDSTRLEDLRKAIGGK